MKKIVIVGLFILLVLAGTVGIVALGVGSYLYQFQVLQQCQYDFFCRPAPVPATAAQLQEIKCARDGKVWDEESHACLSAEESLRRAEEQWKAEKARIQIEYGFGYIPGVAAFQPGDHFWMSPTEEFANLHEYVVGEDGSVMDSIGMVAPAETLKDGRREIIGPDGRPFFTAEISILNDQIWMWWNVVPGRAGWVKVRTEKICAEKGATLYHTGVGIARQAAGYIDVFEVLDGTAVYSDERGVDWALMESCRVAFLYYNSPAIKRVALFAPEGFDLRSLYHKPYMGAGKIVVTQVAGDLKIEVSK